MTRCDYSQLLKDVNYKASSRRKIVRAIDEQYTSPRHMLARWDKSGRAGNRGVVSEVHTSLRTIA